MIAARVRESDFRSLDERLVTLEPKLARNILRTAVRAGGNVVRDAARARVPKDTGLLRRNIRTVVRRGRPGEVVASVGVFAPKPPKGGGKAKVYAYYAPWVERGHKIVPRRGLTPSTLRQRREAAKVRGARVRPYPFLLPALVAKQAEVQRVVMEHIARRLGEVV